ncbi:MAG: hypothetical protein QM682_05435 [Paracoccus sp. (in: a-proteobacteria)]|uniref:hypothetical protein n=1 Tax=Paracoccus sp. TaxID=267 RepID=UPI0039E2DF29
MSASGTTSDTARMIEALHRKGGLLPLAETLARTAALIREAVGAIAVDLWVAAEGGLRADGPWGLPVDAEPVAGADGWVEVPGAEWSLGAARESGARGLIPASGIRSDAEGATRHVESVAVPLAVSGRSYGSLDVIAVAVCHLSEAAAAETLGSAPLWQAAAGVVAVALGIEALRHDARAAADRMRALRDQENARARIAFAQQKLLDAAIGKSSSRAAHLAGVVSSALNRSLLIVDGEGHEVAAVAGPAEKELLHGAVSAVLAGEATTREITGRLLSRDPDTARLSGAILVTPAVSAREVEAMRLIACLADLMSTRLGMLKHDGRMVDVVRPLALLGLCARDTNELRRRDLADLLMVSAGTPLRVASIRTQTPEAAFRCATAIGRGSEAGLGVIAAAALNNDVVVLLRDDAGDLDARFEKLRALLSVQVSVGVSLALNGIDRIAEGYRQSQGAIGRAGKGAVSCHGDTPRLARVLSDLAAGQGESSLRQVLGPVLDLERAERAEILAALRGFIEHDGDLAALASAHDQGRETLAGVLARASALTRLNLAAYQDVAILAALLEFLGSREGA